MKLHEIIGLALLAAGFVTYPAAIWTFLECQYEAAIFLACMTIGAFIYSHIITDYRERPAQP